MVLSQPFATPTMSRHATMNNIVPAPAPVPAPDPAPDPARALVPSSSRRYAQAEAKFREAAAEAALGFPAGDPHIASTKNNLAEFLRNTGRWDEAEELYKEVCVGGGVGGGGVGGGL